MANLLTKVCTICKLEKSSTEFYPIKTKKGTPALDPRCKNCSNEMGKKYRAEKINKKNLIRVDSLEGEIWKDVVGYEGLYMVSNIGRVKRLNTPVHHERLGSISTTERLLGQNSRRSGYKMVKLTKNNIWKIESVHVIVWEAFGNKLRNGFKLVVDHIDNNKDNNCITNLQCITHRHNSSKDRTGKYSKYTGVSWEKYAKKWRAAIVINRKKMNLGLFNSENEAHLAYQKALSEVSNSVLIQGIKSRPKTSRYKGVYLERRVGKWRVCINGKNLGYYHTEEEAHQAYQNALKQSKAA